MISTKRIPTWAHDVIKEAEIYGEPKGIKRQRIHSNYVALMRNRIDEKPTYFEEALKKKEWMQGMIKEYQLIINNDVWDVVPRPKDKSVFSSK